MDRVRKGSGVATARATRDGALAALARFRETHVGQTDRARERTRTLGDLTARPGRASLAAIDDAASTNAAIDGDRATAKRTEDVRHGAFPRPTGPESVNVGGLLPPSRSTCARAVVMDPITWMLGAVARRLRRTGVRLSCSASRCARASAPSRMPEPIPHPPGRAGCTTGAVVAGRPVVFVHGFGTEAAVNWYAVADHLSPPNGTWIAPYLPGFGASERLPSDELHRPPGPVSAYALLDDLGTQRGSTLVGHSHGRGGSASPSRPRIRSASNVWWSSTRPAFRFDPDMTLERALSSIGPSRMSVSGLRANLQRPPRLPAFVLRDLLACRAPGTRSRGKSFLRRLVYGDEHLDDRLGSITAPTLVVWGRRRSSDAAGAGKTGSARGYRRGLNSSSSADCAHSPNVEQPDRFNGLLPRVSPPAVSASTIAARWWRAVGSSVDEEPAPAAKIAVEKCLLMLDSFLEYLP